MSDDLIYVLFFSDGPEDKYIIAVSKNLNILKNEAEEYINQHGFYALDESRISIEWSLQYDNSYIGNFLRDGKRDEYLDDCRMYILEKPLLI